MQTQKPGSTRPYLIRAWHEWCSDNGLTPYIAVAVDDSVTVPREYVNHGEIILNVSYEATTALRMDNDYLDFKARFAGVVRQVTVPVDRVQAIFARENNQGLTFPQAEAETETSNPSHGAAPQPVGGKAHQGLTCVPSAPSQGSEQSPSTPAARPTLTRIK